MPPGSVDDIFVEIEVRLERLETGLRNAERTIGSSVDRMDKTVKRVGEGFGGISSNVQKALITLGALHISLRTVESLANVAGAGFQFWTADIEDTGEALDKFLQALDRIPEIGTAFLAGREIGAFGRGFSLKGFDEFFRREADPILADIGSFLDKFLLAFDRSLSGKENIKRFGFATQIAGLTEVQRKAAERELSILQAITREEKIRLQFLFQREDLERTITELSKIQGRIGGNLGLALGGKINEFEQTILDLIDAREREALKKRSRGRDPTESTITALGTATFGAGGFNPQPPLDPPTKRGQDEQRQESKLTNQRLGQLIEAVQGIGFQ